MHGQEAIDGTWFFMRWFNQFRSTIENGFSQWEENYPGNEAGELIRRQMAQKSWFDEISSWWVGRSFIGKVAYIGGFALAVGLLGLLLNASLLLSAVALFLSLAIHKLFSLHEQKRREAANLLAQESIDLIANLQASQVYLNETVSSLQAEATILKMQASGFKEQALMFDLDQQQIEDSNTKLTVIVEEVSEVNQELRQHAHDVTEKIEAISEHLEQYDRTLTGLTSKAASHSGDLSDFSITVHHLRDTQNALASVVSRFSMFEPSSQEAAQQEDEFLSQLIQQNDEDERLIRGWSL